VEEEKETPTRGEANRWREKERERKEEREMERSACTPPLGISGRAWSINTLRRVNSVCRPRGRATTGINRVHDTLCRGLTPRRVVGRRAVAAARWRDGGERGIISSSAILRWLQFVFGRWIKRQRRCVICNLDNGTPLPESRKAFVSRG